MATIYEVSQAAGVSLATVSRVMNNSPKVSEKTKNKVLAAMAELGYQPNAIAQSLASNRTNSVGLLVSELHGSFFGDMMSTVESVLKNAGKHVIITAGHSDETAEQAAIDFLLSRKCDALILHAESVSPSYLKTLLDRGIELLLINRFVPEIKERCFTLNNELGGYLATKAAIDEGHTEIAYISGPSSKQDASERLAGHKRALAEAQLPFSNSDVFEGQYHEEDGIKGVHNLFDTGKRYSAIVCANDEMASGAMTAARELGLKVPEQLSVVGFDDVIFARYLYPKLTTIYNPIKEIGEMAAHWVLQNVYGAKATKKLQYEFQPHLVSRDSLRPN